MPYYFPVCDTQSHCDSEDNVQCVPTNCDDNYHSQDSHNNPGTSQQVCIHTVQGRKDDEHFSFLDIKP